jgi:hypothetical protein
MRELPQDIPQSNVRKFYRIESTRTLEKTINEFIKTLTPFGVSTLTSYESEPYRLKSFKQNNSLDECSDGNAKICTWDISAPQGLPSLEIYLREDETKGNEVVSLSSTISEVSLAYALPQLVKALELANGLVCTKIALQSNKLILSTTLHGKLINLTNLNHHYELLCSQYFVLLEELL